MVMLLWSLAGGGNSFSLFQTTEFDIEQSGRRASECPEPDRYAYYEVAQTSAIVRLPVHDGTPFRASVLLPHGCASELRIVLW